MDYKAEIEKMKKERDALILAHYYVDGEIQEVADYVGDSFYLAQLAREVKEKNIIMAGVYFMGESIKILSPEKNVYMVDHRADCPMAHMVSKEDIAKVREKYQDLAVVCYVNSTAEIKAHSDVCVTSSNALQIVKDLEEKNIYFIPDKNLGSYIKGKVRDKNIILHENGCCPIHNRVKRGQVWDMKERYPGAKILVHPECAEDVVDLADYIGSTKGIIAQSGKEGKEFIIVTEKGISHMLEKSYPEKSFYYIDTFICKDMKVPSLDQVLTCMDREENLVVVEDGVAKEALRPLNRMLEMGAKSGK